jgi:delta-1-pyrroline-5-carboxylate synthetase
LNVFFSKLA